MLSCFVCAFVALTIACNTAQKMPAAPPAPPAFITWEKKLIDLGLVKKGEKRSMVFEFTNTSGAPAQIDIVDACDCTKVEFPRSPIAPSQKGRLDVTFDSKDKDADETIDVRLIFLNTDAVGNPRIELIQYKYQLAR